MKTLDWITLALSITAIFISVVNLYFQFFYKNIHAVIGILGKGTKFTNDPDKKEHYYRFYISSVGRQNIRVIHAEICVERAGVQGVSIINEIIDLDDIEIKQYESKIIEFTIEDKNLNIYKVHKPDVLYAYFYLQASNGKKREQKIILTNTIFDLFSENPSPSSNIIPNHLVLKKFKK